jgi:hypothetical protein
MPQRIAQRQVEVDHGIELAAAANPVVDRLAHRFLRRRIRARACEGRQCAADDDEAPPGSNPAIRQFRPAAGMCWLVAGFDPTEKADPFFKTAMEAVVKGENVAQAVTRPYGCGVKYKS